MMTADLLSGDADVTDHTADSSSGNEHPFAFAPTFIQLVEEVLVVLQSPKLCLMAFVFLQSPIRRRGDYEVNTLVWNPREITRIAYVQAMVSG